MVYIHSWQDFQDAAEALYTKAPSQTRYCVKWKASEGKLVLKITDNTSCIKFKTYSSIFLNRFEALNLSLIQKMQNKRQVEIPTPIAADHQPTGAEPPTRALPQKGAPSKVSASAPSPGVSKKSKTKKKK